MLGKWGAALLAPLADDGHMRACSEDDVLSFEPGHLGWPGIKELQIACTGAAHWRARGFDANQKPGPSSFALLAASIAEESHLAAIAPAVESTTTPARELLPPTGSDRAAYPWGNDLTRRDERVAFARATGEYANAPLPPDLGGF